MGRDLLATAASGVKTVNDTTELVEKFSAFFVLEDTIIASIEVNGDTATDVKASYITTPATAVKAGAFYTTRKSHKYFSAITLTSGSVQIIY